MPSIPLNLISCGLIASALLGASTHGAPGGTPVSPTVPSGAAAPAPASLAVRKPKSPAAWSISFKYNSVNPKILPDSVVNSISVTKIGEDSLQIIQFRSRSSELWRTQGMTFISDLGADTAIPHTPLAENLAAPSAYAGESPARPPSGPLDPESIPPEDVDWSALEEFNWVRPELLKGKVSLGGQPTLIYAELPPLPPTPPNAKQQPPPKKWPVGPLGGLPLQPGIKVAAIDEATLLPKALQLGDEIRQYTFSTPTQSRLEIPAKVTFFLPPEPATPATKPRN